MPAEHEKQVVVLKKAKPTVSLVLSSGGARGLAHIGAIRCLEEFGYEVRNVSGSSMGALIGGVYAAGQLDEFQSWVCDLTKADVVQLLDFSFWAGPGLIKGKKIIEVLKELVGEHDIEELPIGFTAVATKLRRKREVWLSKGPLFDAVRASIAIPMVLTPVPIGDDYLVDGAVVNPLPIAPTLTDQTDLTVAVDVNGPDRQLPHTLESEPLAADAQNEGVFGNLLSDWFSESDEDDKSMFNVAMESMDAMQASISRLKLAAYYPDHLVQLPRTMARFFEFERAEELIELGYEATQASLKVIEDAPK